MISEAVGDGGVIRFRDKYVHGAVSLLSEVHSISAVKGR